MCPSCRFYERGVQSRLEERAAKAIESPMFVEQFRRASATLIEAQAAGNLKVLLVASASPGDGKTLTALNLALVLGRSYGRRVLLIDGDLRRPSLHRVVGVGNRSGLTDALQARADVRLEVMPITETVTLLPAGPADPDPMRSMSSARMKRVIQEAAQRFDWVIIDSAPLGAVADASVLATLVDGIVFVVRAEHSQYPAVKKAMQTLGHERILGVILNGVSGNWDDSYYYNGNPRWSRDATAPLRVIASRRCYSSSWSTRSCSWPSSSRRRCVLATLECCSISACCGAEC